MAGEIREKKYASGSWNRPLILLDSADGCNMVVSHFDETWGYPRICWKGKMHRVCRLVYELKKGRIPEGLIVRHTCDNRLCINPDHLILGTRRENSMDAVERSRMQRGEMRPNHILTEDAVLEIRGSSRSAKYFSKKYGCSEAAVRLARKRINWKYVGVTHGAQ